MANKQYVKGRRYEYKVKKDYEALGYVVLRTAGSHGFADLIAISTATREVIFIQCKTSKLTPKERDKIYSDNEYKGAYKVSFSLL